MILKSKAIICDLDGTLFNADHRVHHVKKSPKDWETFFSLIHLDPPNEWCLDLVHAYYSTNIYEVLFVTGRNENEREVSTQQLLKHTHIRPEHLNLFMRPLKDARPDTEMKRDLYLNQIAPHYRVMLAIDDKGTVTTVWRNLGIAGLQCDDWEEREALESGTTDQEVHAHFRKKNHTQVEAE